MKILIFGGRGFVGKKVSQKLRKEGHQVITSDRHQGGEDHREADITNLSEVKQAAQDVDLVINLVGLSPLSEPKNTTYQEVHVGGAKNIAQLDKPVIQMSALGADSDSDISYLKTKGKAEEIITQNLAEYTVLRPSLIFGEDSELFEIIKLAENFRAFPFITTKVQPIYVGGIAEIINLIISGKIKQNVLELGGPEQMSIYDMVKQVFQSDGYTCWPIPFAKTGAKLISCFDKFGWTGITEDQVKFLNYDNILDKNDASEYIEVTKFSSWLKNNYK
jgi:NADH dehydrogenase